MLEILYDSIVLVLDIVLINFCCHSLTCESKKLILTSSYMMHVFVC